MKKTFDCLKMKEEIQAKIYNEIKDMTPDEKLNYFNRKAQNSDWWNRLPDYKISGQTATDRNVVAK